MEVEGAIWKHETGYEGGLSLKSKEVSFEVVRDGKGRLRIWTRYFYESGPDCLVECIGEWQKDVPLFSWLVSKVGLNQSQVMSDCTKD